MNRQLFFQWLISLIAILWFGSKLIKQLPINTAMPRHDPKPKSKFGIIATVGNKIWRCDDPYSGTPVWTEISQTND